MRISTSQMQSVALTAMMERQSELSKTQQQIATGLSFQTPADDVLGATQVLALQKVIATHEQYDENSFNADSRLRQEEGAVTQTIDILQRARELSIQGLNTTYTAESRAAIAVEVRAILGSVISMANVADSTGEFIFAGHNVDTAPFTETENPVGSGLYDYAYTGDLGQRAVQIGVTRFIPVGDPGQNVFVDVPESGGGTRSVFDTLEQLALSLETNTPDATMPDDLLLAMEHLGSVRAELGARQNAIESFRVLNADIIFQSQKTLSEVQDLDYAEAISRMNSQLAGLEASQLSFSKIQNLSLFNFL